MKTITACILFLGLALCSSADAQICPADPNQIPDLVEDIQASVVQLIVDREVEENRFARRSRPPG
jgi:hypothetical protein